MRHELIASLTRQLSAVVSRRVGMAVGIWGEPGIGKTHTVHAIAQHLPCAHLSLHATVSFAHIAASLPRARTLPTWTAAQLERMGRGEPIEARAVVQTLAAALNALAPFVLHLEDLHEASAERVALVESLARAVLRSRGVGFLVTSRAQLPEPFRNHHLEGLSKAETTLLLEQELKARPPEDGLEWVLGRTRGNPLFTLEFVRYLRRQGFFWSDGERWHWRRPPEDFVPVSIGALVTELVSGTAITAEARAVIEALALLPGGWDTVRSKGLWAGMAGVNELRLEEIRVSFERAGLLRGDDFAHPLFAEVIAGELEAEAKCALAGRALEVLKETDPEAAAEFIALAGLRDEEALELLKRAVSQAREHGEEIHAARLIGRAAQYATGEERVSLALEAEAGLVPTGDYPAREQLSQLALETQPENREARFALMNVYSLTGRVDHVEALISALPAAEQRELRWIEGRFRVSHISGRDHEAVALWEEHAELRSVRGDRNLHYAVTAYLTIGAWQRAEEIINATLRRTDLREPMYMVLNQMLAMLRSDQGRLEEADTLNEKVIAFVQKHDNINNLASAHYNRADNQVRMGQFAAARGGCETAISLFEQSGNGAAAAYASILYADLLMHQLAFERAEEVLLGSYESFWHWNTSPRRVECEIELALLYSQWRPPHGETLALKFAHDALNHARALENTGMTRLALASLARVSLSQGEALRALELAREALGLIETDALAETKDGYTCVRMVAEALELNERHAEALERWGEALHIAQALQFSFESHEATLEIARLQSDWEGVRSQRAWFAERGLGLGVRRADACLETPPLEIPALPTARINVLGTVTLERDGQPVPTRAKKRLEILAYLLETRVAGRSETGTLELVDTFYPNVPEPEARNALKQQIFLIRASLGTESVVSTPSGYALGAVSSDAEDALRFHDSDLWRGPYLASLGEGWISGVRDALVLGLRAQAESLLEPNPPEATRLGRILYDMDPYDAEALRLVVRALRAAGEVRAAQRTFLEARVIFEEVGEPLPGTLDGFLAGRVMS